MTTQQPAQIPRRKSLNQSDAQPLCDRYRAIALATALPCGMPKCNSPAHFGLLEAAVESASAGLWQLLPLCEPCARRLRLGALAEGATIVHL
jgi:hypothetical protein